MKRIIAVFIIVLLLVGCSPGGTVSTEPGTAGDAPGRIADMELTAPHTFPNAPAIDNADIPYIYVPIAVSSVAAGQQIEAIQITYAGFEVKEFSASPGDQTPLSVKIEPAGAGGVSGNLKNL